MRKRIAFVVIGICFLFNTCTENNLGPNFLFRTDKFKNYPQNNFWVFISDQNGKTLGVKQVTPSDPIVQFNGLASGLITLTTVSKYQDNSNGLYEQYSIESYQEIVPGSEYLLDTTTYHYSSIPDVVGKAAFTLQDYNDSDQPFLSVFLEDGHISSNFLLDINSLTYQGSTFSADMRLRDNPRDILIHTYRDGIPVYQWLQNVKVGDAITTSFQSLVPSKTIAVNKQVAYGFVAGLHGNGIEDGYYGLSNLASWTLSKSSDKSQVPKLGYIDGFEKYFTNVSLNPIGGLGTNWMYNKLGSLPSSIQVPDFNLSITNNNLIGFSFKFSNNYKYKLAYFETSTDRNTPGTHVTWYFTAGTKDFVVPEIPQEIRQQFPSLKLDNLTLSWMNWLDELDGYSYQDYLKQALTYPPPRQIYETFNYSIISRP